MDISVIIPIYNVEEYLTDCLESVRRNVTGLDAEVLLIDDGSTDYSSIIARLYAEKLEKFTYYRTENGGLSRARNYGVTLAKGKYLYFVDSDDMLVDGILKKMLDVSERNGSELTVCNVARSKDKKIAGSSLALRSLHGLGETVSHITKHPNLVYDSTSWNKLILRSFYDRFAISFPEGYTYEDMLPGFMMHYHCNNVSVILETGYLYCVRTGVDKQITKEHSRKNLTDKIEMMACTLEYARACSASPDILEVLETKFLAFDFDGWLNILHTLPENTAMEYVKLIKNFVTACINRECIKKIPLIKQQIYKDIMQDDYAHLLKVVNYKNTNYPRAPLVEKDGRLEMVLPADIFTIKSRDAAYEFGNNGLPDFAVDSVTATGGCISLLGHLYEKRVNIPFDGTDYFKAMLLNGSTGHALPLKINSVRRPDITEAQGSILNYDDYSYYQYDYDGAGFKIDVDFEEIHQNREMQGINYIIISYDFKYCAGNWLLKGIPGNAKKTAEKFSYENEECKGEISFDVQNIIQIILKNSRNSDLQNPGADILLKVSPAFNSTTAGKQLVKLQKENKKLQKELQRFKKQAANLSRELDNVKRGRSFRIGRKITWLPRKLRDWVCRNKQYCGKLLKGESAIEPYAFIRAKNEAITLKASLNSILPIIKKGVIAYNDCTDGSDLIIQDFCKRNPGFIPFYYPHHVVESNSPDYSTDKIPYENTLAAYYNAALAFIPQNSWLIKIDCDQIYFPDILKKSFSLPQNNFEVVAYSRLDLVRYNNSVKVIEYKRPGDHWLIYNNNLKFINRHGYDKNGEYYAWELLVMPKEYKVLYKPECSSFHFPIEKGYRIVTLNEDKLMSLEQFRKIADPKEISPELLEDKVINRIISSFEY